MVQYRSGIINSTTALISSGVNLMLGFIPDRFQMYNLTILEVNPPSSGTVAESLWLKPMPDGSSLQTTYTTGAPAVSYVTTNGVTPVKLGGDWQNTIYTITNISSATPAVVTVSSVTPTNAMTLVNGMTFTISSVVGVTNVNTNRYIVAGLSGTTFNLYDTFGNPVTANGTYVSGGEMDVISYPPTPPTLNSVTGQILIPGQPAGNQYDIGYEGLTLGSAVLGANGNVLWWEAIWQTPTGW